MILADTDVLIDALHGKGAAERIRIELGSRHFGTTAVTAFELRSGAKRKKQRDAVAEMLGGLTVVPLDDPAAERAAAIRVELEARGQTIGMADYLIAGICLERDAILLTRNRAHFERVPGLRLGTVDA